MREASRISDAETTTRRGRLELDGARATLQGQGKAIIAEGLAAMGHDDHGANGAKGPRARGHGGEGPAARSPTGPRSVWRSGAEEEEEARRKGGR
eukprot:167422-Pyramimonas_sp.AAC.1